MSNEAYHVLRKAILAGELRPGTWLVECVIAEHMQISRGPIREALKRLQQEGLVTEIPRKGKQVTFLTETDVRELYVLRAMLEGYGVRQLCAASRRGLAVDRLQRILARMRKAALSGNMTRFSLIDFEFHRELMTSSGMPRLYQLWSSLYGLLMIWLLSVQDSVRQLRKEVLNDHLGMVNAIKAGDGSLAKKLLCEHMAKFGERALQVSRQMAVEAPRAVPPRRRTARPAGVRHAVESP